MFVSFDSIETNHINIRQHHLAFITTMISQQVLLSSVVDIIVIIFQKKKLNGILVGDIEKNNPTDP